MTQYEAWLEQYANGRTDVVSLIPKTQERWPELTRTLLARFDPFQDALPCFMAKGVERTGYILRIQARMDFMMGVR